MGIRLANPYLTQRWAGLACLVLALILGISSGVWSQSILGSAGDYAVFGISPSPGVGTYLNLSNVTINGDVGEGPYGTGHVFAPTHINGNYYYDTTATPPKIDGSNLITGAVLVKDLTQANQDALNAYNYAAGLTPTQTFGSITNATTIVGNGGLNVIQINGSINLSDGKNLTLSGGPNDFFILNVTGTITMGGSAEITGVGGVDASRVLINVVGTGSTLTSHVDNVINGTILAPYRDVNFHSANGAILAGGGTLTLMSGATVNHVPLVPEPSGVAGALSLLGPSMLFLRNYRRKQACK